MTSEGWMNRELTIDCSVECST